MIEELRIKCPSCGIILSVKNSKHEAIKRIICPNCKKQLAVDFQEKLEPKPIAPLYYGQMPIALHEGINQVQLPGCEHIEINVVHIKDGSCKCIVRPLSAGHPVKINGDQMDSEDKVVLAIGDKLQVGDTTLSYGKPLETFSTPPKPSTPPKLGYHSWVYGGIAFIAGACIAFLLAPNKCRSEKSGEEKVENSREETEVIPNDITEESNDTTTAINTHVAVIPNITPPLPHQPSSTARPTTDATPSIKNMSDYDLEKEAHKGNVAAQCELGKRKVKMADSTSIVLGINYLKLAVGNGSTEARQLLQATYHRLEQMAANGNSTAANILRNNR